MQYCYLMKLLLLALFLSVSQAWAQSPSFSMRASFGAVHLSLSRWSDFFSASSDNVTYQNDDVNFYPGLSVHYHIDSHHAIGLGTELLKTAASGLYAQNLFDGSGNRTGFIPLAIAWKFKGIPIKIGYEYTALAANKNFRPAFGIGVSYFMSKVEAQTTNLASSLLDEQKTARKGRGYGVHAHLALHTQLYKRLSLISQARYRYADGMAFSDRKGDVKVEFTGFDLSLGIEWSI